jgi:hypothetical protein
MATRIYVIYAPEDHRGCEQFISQIRSSKLAVDFDHLESKMPWVPAWKVQARSRIFGCDGAILLLSKRTEQAAGIKWELECAREIGIPILVVHVDKYNKASVPNDLRDLPVIEWNSAEIIGFIRSLNQDASSATGSR